MEKNHPNSIYPYGGPFRRCKLVKKIQGVVIRVFPSRGFGFVRDTDSNLTRFFHVNDYINRVDFDKTAEGMLISYIPMEVKKKETNGLIARRIELEGAKDGVEKTTGIHGPRDDGNEQGKGSDSSSRNNKEVS